MFQFPRTRRAHFEDLRISAKFGAFTRNSLVRDIYTAHWNTESGHCRLRTSRWCVDVFFSVTRQLILGALNALDILFTSIRNYFVKHVYPNEPNSAYMSVRYHRATTGILHWRPILFRLVYSIANAIEITPHLLQWHAEAVDKKIIYILSYCAINELILWKKNSQHKQRSWTKRRCRNESEASQIFSIPYTSSFSNADDSIFS